MPEATHITIRHHTYYESMALIARPRTEITALKTLSMIEVYTSYLVSQTGSSHILKTHCHVAREHSARLVAVSRNLTPIDTVVKLTDYR